MRLWFSGPRILGIRPGISISPDELFGKRRARNNIPAAISESSFVYVIKDEAGRVKIGSSNDPSRRLKELQTGHPERLTLEFIGASTIDGAVIERMAHNVLHNYRINNEWFSISTAYAISAIYGVAAKHEAKIKQITEMEAQQVMRIMSGLEAMPERRKPQTALFIAALVVLIVLVLLIVAAPAHAGGHFENGHWLVTSDKREKQFFDCIDNAQEMDAETERCINDHGEKIQRGEATPETPMSDRCEGKFKSYMSGQLPCLAGLENPKFGGDN